MCQPRRIKRVTILDILLLVAVTQFSVTEMHMPSPEECWSQYPYTYSKCLKLCSINMDPTCLDDQLCYCDSSGQNEIRDKTAVQILEDDHGHEETYEIPNLNIFFGTKTNAVCHFSNFCEDLCGHDEKLVDELQLHEAENNAATGALCKLSVQEYGYLNEVESCVCRIIGKQKLPYEHDKIDDNGSSWYDDKHNKVYLNEDEYENR